MTGRSIQEARAARLSPTRRRRIAPIVRTVLEPGSAAENPSDRIHPGGLARPGSDPRRPRSGWGTSPVKVAAIPASHPERISSDAGRGTISKNLGKIFSPRLGGRSVEKMAPNGETAFKDLQNWTILLVGRERGKR